MLVRLLPNQIPLVWEAIKYTIVQVELVQEKDYQNVFNYVIKSLLSDKAQCWVRLNDERRIVCLMLTEIQANKMTGAKTLVPRVLYSWRPTGNDEWMRDIEELKIFARKVECSEIVVESASPRMWDIYTLGGFKEKTRKYTFEVS